MRSSPKRSVKFSMVSCSRLKSFVLQVVLWLPGVFNLYVHHLVFTPEKFTINFTKKKSVKIVKIQRFCTVFAVSHFNFTRKIPKIFGRKSSENTLQFNEKIPKIILYKSRNFCT